MIFKIGGVINLMNLFDIGGLNLGYLQNINDDDTGKQLKRIRKEHNFSVQDIQHQIGLISAQAIYKWERGQALPSLDNIVILAKLYEVTLDDLLVIE